MKQIICPDCNGSGEGIVTWFGDRCVCPSCGGDGTRFPEHIEEAD